MASGGQREAHGQRRGSWAQWNRGRSVVADSRAEWEKRESRVNRYEALGRDPALDNGLRSDFYWCVTRKQIGRMKGDG